MSWKPIDGINDSKRKALMARILKGEVPSYVDEHGKRMVWMAGELPPFWALELVARVRQEVADMRRSMNASGARLRNRRRAA